MSAITHERCFLGQQSIAAPKYLVDITLHEDMSEHDIPSSLNVRHCLR
jgi:hypothetical protein